VIVQVRDFRAEDAVIGLLLVVRTLLLLAEVNGFVFPAAAETHLLEVEKVFD
jgi:hypothetical protein